MKKNIAIVLAAGKGTRMGTDRPKQFLDIQDKPVLYYSLKQFQESDIIDEIILVIGREYQQYCKEEILVPYNLTKVKKMIEGGAERYHSVYQGLKECENCGYVFIHDGARPFISEEILKRCIENVRKEQACVVAMPVKDTIKIADPEGYVETTPSREKVWMVQTPQVFSYDLVWKAYQKMMLTDGVGITDDAMVVELFADHKIKLIKGSYENIKITTPEDIIIAENFLKNSVDKL